METKKILGYVPFAILVLLVYLSFLVIKPFLSTIIGGFIVAYIFYPLYVRFEKRFQRKNLAAILVAIIILLLLTVPLVFILNAVVKEANLTYLRTKVILDTGVLPQEDCTLGSESVLCTVAARTNNLITSSTLDYYIKESAKRMTLFFTQTAGKMLVALPSAVINLFLMLFIVFFSLRDGKLFFEKLDSIIPLDANEKNRIFSSIKNMTHGVIYGSVVVAFIQGVLGGLGFFFFGISSPVLWGIIMGLLAFVPLIGPMLVWLPAALLLVADGFAQDQNMLIFKGVGLLVYGFILISSVENFLKPMIIGNRVKTHPVIIIIGVLGGIKAFGILGIVLGPLILELLVTFVAIVREHWTKSRR